LAGPGLPTGMGASISGLMRRLLRPIWFFLALLFLLEAWIWERLSPAVRWLIDKVPFVRLKAAIARGIDRLPPYATLLVFAIPAAMLFPFKLLGLWLIGGGHVVAGALVFFLAKSVGLAVSAFLFETCRDKLMRIGWFVWLYDHIVRVKVWAMRQAEPARRWIGILRRRLAGKRAGLLSRIARWRRWTWRRAG
jgi:hypothetical protein